MSKISFREKFIILIDNEILKKSDAIVVLEGDGYYRLTKTTELFKNKWAKLIVISGGKKDIKAGSIPAKIMRRKLMTLGVSTKNILLEEKSTNTREQAENVLLISKERKWKRIILVASNYHQYRAFLTFLKIILASGIKLEIINAPATLPWHRKNKWGKRIDLLDLEFKKISTYSKKGHVATFNEAIQYNKKKIESI